MTNNKETITDDECYNGMRILEKNCDCHGDFRIPYQIEERTKVKFKVDFYKHGYLKVNISLCKKNLEKVLQLWRESLSE